MLRIPLRLLRTTATRSTISRPIPATAALRRPKSSAAAAAPRDDARGHGGLEGALLLAVVVACVAINPLSRFSAMTWPRWLRRAVRNRHLHVNLISTQLGAIVRILIRVDFF